VKLVFQQDDRKLLGVHVLGDLATELVHQGQAVLNYGGTIDYFIHSTFNVPTASEAYKYARRVRKFGHGVLQGNPASRQSGQPSQIPAVSSHRPLHRVPSTIQAGSNAIRQRRGPPRRPTPWAK
jgi:hypothetical protein